MSSTGTTPGGPQSGTPRVQVTTKSQGPKKSFWERLNTFVTWSGLASIAVGCVVGGIYCNEKGRADNEIAKDKGIVSKIIKAKQSADFGTDVQVEVSGKNTDGLFNMKGSVVTLTLSKSLQSKMGTNQKTYEVLFEAVKLSKSEYRLIKSQIESGINAVRRKAKDSGMMDEADINGTVSEALKTPIGRSVNARIQNPGKQQIASMGVAPR